MLANSILKGLFKGVVDGVDEDVRRLGGTISYKGQQVVVSLSGHTKAVDLSAIDSLAELVQAFSSMPCVPPPTATLEWACGQLGIPGHRGHGQVPGWEFGIYATA